MLPKIPTVKWNPQNTAIHAGIQQLVTYARLNPAWEQLDIASQRKFDLNLVWEALVTKGERTLGLRKQM